MSSQCCYNRHHLYLGIIIIATCMWFTELFTNSFMLAKIIMYNRLIVILSLVITTVINYSYLITPNQ